MDTTTLSSLAHLSDQELLARVTHLAAEERQATALLIAHLAELDARRLYLAEGYSSLFTYCTQALHLSEHAAYGRIEAARASRTFPVLLELLSEGSLTLTTVGLLAPHLTAENHQDLLDKARFKSKRAVEDLIAGLSPQPVVPTVVRQLPAARPHPEPPAMQAGAQPTLDTQEMGGATAPVARVAPPARQRATITPLTPQRYKVQFTASAETYEKLRLAQDLLRHQIPDGDLDQIVQRALAALLEDLARQKLSATERPRRGRPTAPTRVRGRAILRHRRPGGGPGAARLLLGPDRVRASSRIRNCQWELRAPQVDRSFEFPVTRPLASAAESI